MGIGKRIREARLQKHMTQQELGRLLGVTKGAIANYENDTSHPKEAVLYQLFQALSVDANYLFQDALSAQQQTSSGLSHGTCAVQSDPPQEDVSAPFSFTLRERQHLKKYRLLSEYSRDTIDYLMERELNAAEHRSLSTDIDTRTMPPAISRHHETPDILQIYPYLSMTASAGFSTYSDDIPQDRLQAPFCRNADFIIGVNGDSMTPLYQNGDLLYVERTDHVPEGEIGIFSRNGELYVKKAGRDRLISLNPEYPDITADGSLITAVGRVLKRVDPKMTAPAD